MINDKSPFEIIYKTDSPFTILAKLFSTGKKLYFVNDKIRAGCPKLQTKNIVRFIKHEFVV